MIRQLHEQGLSVSEIARRTGHDRKTVRSVLRRGGLPKPRMRRGGVPREKKLEPFKPYLRERMAQGVFNAVVLFDEIRARGYTGGMTVLRRFIRPFRPRSLGLPATLRFETEPGEQAQADFVDLRVLDGTTHQEFILRIFEYVLGYSRVLYGEFMPSEDRLHFFRGLDHAFRATGGVPRVVLTDNASALVSRRDENGQPVFAPEYLAFARHYGFTPKACRPYRAQTKPRVERQMPYVRESLWRGDADKLLSLEAMNQRALEWCREVAGLRIHGTTHRRPLEVFQAEEKPRLQRLPPTPWEPSTWTTAKVGPDAHCQVAGALYSVPHLLRGQRLDVRLTQKLVEFYRGEELVKVHPRRHDRGRTTDPADLPPDKVAFYERTPQWCLKRAQELGPDVLEAVRSLLAVDTLTHLRQAQGILRLEQTYGAERLNAACQRTVAFGDPRYRTVKTILARGLDQEPLPEAPPLAKAGAYLRGREAFTFPMAGR
ncbi:MAG: IS21 family transposase [Clostridia bacterium]|nr:IS21 family transposase [Clostridia bacterium]